MITVIAYSKENGYHLLDQNQLPAHIRDEKRDMLWIDFEAATPAEITLLSSFFSFHPLAIEDCVTETLLPKVDDFGDYIFLVLHGSQATEGDRFETTELNIFLGVNYLVTYHNTASRSIKEARERCMKNLPSISRGTDFLLHEILDRMVDRYLPVLEEMEKTAEKLESDVFAHPRKETLNKIVTLKKKVMLFRRVIVPQQEILNRLSRDSFAVISPKAAIYYRDVYDHLARISELADSCRDHSSSTLQVYLSVVSNRTNDVMRVLTVFTAIFMPLMLITGIYGMNFDRPEFHAPYGYAIVMGAMGTIAIGLVLYFRKRKWL